MNPQFAFLEDEAEEAIRRQADGHDNYEVVEPKPSMPESSFWARDWGRARDAMMAR